jgi:DNA polymerase V
LSTFTLSNSDFDDYGRKNKDNSRENTGIPVGVGIAKTKSLAKLANKFAKKLPEKMLMW